MTSTRRALRRTARCGVAMTGQSGVRFGRKAGGERGASGADSRRTIGRTSTQYCIAFCCALIGAPRGTSVIR